MWSFNSCITTKQRHIQWKCIYFICTTQPIWCWAQSSVLRTSTESPRRQWRQLLCNALLHFIVVVVATTCGHVEKRLWTLPPSPSPPLSLSSPLPPPLWRNANQNHRYSLRIGSGDNTTTTITNNKNATRIYIHRKTSNHHVIYCLRNESLFIKLAN